MSVIVKRVKEIPEGTTKFFSIGLMRNDSNELLEEIDFMQLLSYIGMVNMGGDEGYYTITPDVCISASMTVDGGEMGKAQLMESAKVLADALNAAMDNLQDDQRKCAESLILSYNIAKTKF